MASAMLVALSLPLASDAASAATVSRLGSAGPANASQAEPLPDYFYSTASIPAGKSSTTVYDRRVIPPSLIFLTVDTTDWPGADLSLPGVEVVGRGGGVFQVATLDGSQAPGPGITFTYAVFDNASADGFTAGTGTIPVGVHNTGVNIGAATATSAVILTVDRQQPVGAAGLTAVPGVKLNNHGASSITVTTLDDSPAAVPITFDWLVFNETVTVSGQPEVISCFSLACGTGTIPVGVPNVGVTDSSVSLPTAVLLTADVTSYPSDLGVPGVKVNARGAGFFSVTTDTEVAVPAAASKGLPFQFVVLQPPAAWEELGPTGRSGNAEALAVDPSDPAHTWYTGSVHGGVWKTTDGGDSWYQAWYTTDRQPLPMKGVYALAFSPGGALVAVAEDGSVFESIDHAVSWSPLTGPGSAVSSNLLFRGVRVAADGSNTVYLCSDAGLWSLASDSTAWSQVGPASEGKCSDVVVDGTTVYAAFRGVGVVQLLTRPLSPGSRIQVAVGWLLLKAAVHTSEFPDDPIHFALNALAMVVSEGCDCGMITVSVNRRSNLSGANPAASWGNPVATLPETTGSGPGYSITAAISPSGETVIAGGRGAYISNQGGAAGSFRKINMTAQTGEMHQFALLDDSTIVGVVDGGVRLTHDGGQTWSESTDRSQNIDGPPVTEYCNVVTACFSVSNPDQFGQVLAGGAVQDIGGVAVFDRPTGAPYNQGEFVLTAVAPRPTDFSTSAGPVSRLRVVATEAVDTGSGEGLTAKSADLCDFSVTGAIDPNAEGSQDGYGPSPVCTKYPVIPAASSDKITAIGISQQSPDSILVGTAGGTIYRFVRIVANGEPGPTEFQQIVSGGGDMVTAIGFATDTIAYVGHESGAVTRITDPFGSPAVQAVPITTQSVNGATQAVVTFAFQYGDPNQVYVAFKDDVVGSTNAASSSPVWNDLLVCGNLSPICQALTLAAGVSGLVRDPAHADLYVALGPLGVPSGNSVWQLALPGGTAFDWASFSTGLPPGVRVTGLGIAANKALYLATDGRGLFWRRDIATTRPNSGVNTPAYASVKADQAIVITTRCSYPTGWRHIAELDFKLAQGHGPGDGDPLAAWLELDRKDGLLRLYNPATRAWEQGSPGSAATLSNGQVTLILARSSVNEVTGATPPTVQIRWALTITAAAAGNLQQYLRVTDDSQATTSWDKVGELVVARPPSVWIWRSIVALVALAAVVLAAGAAVLWRRRRSA